MATDIKALVDAMAERLRLLRFQVWTEPPGSVDTPAAIILLGQIDYDTTMDRGSDDMEFTIDLYFTDGGQGLESMYTCLSGSGDMSVKAAFERDPTFDGLAHDVAISSTNRPDRASLGGAELLHVQLNVEAKVSG